MNNKLWMFGFIALLSVGCSSEEIPQAHKGRMFEKTGALALYSGEKGFSGAILGPGTHYTGVYNELRIVDCSNKIVKETLPSLTKDGVQFSLDVYISYTANCEDDKAVEKILNKFSPANTDPEKHPELKNTVVASQLYDTVVRPALGEAVRKPVSNYIANDINENREVIFTKITEDFNGQMAKHAPKLVVINDFKLSNLDFPDQLDQANVARAEQSVLKDKAIAERSKIDAEIETANKKRELAEKDGNTEAARIDALGSAYRRNPEVLQLELMRAAAEKGNLIITQ